MEERKEKERKKRDNHKKCEEKKEEIEHEGKNNVNVCVCAKKESLYVLTCGMFKLAMCPGWWGGQGRVGEGWGTRRCSNTW